MTENTYCDASKTDKRQRTQYRCWSTLAERERNSLPALTYDDEVTQNISEKLSSEDR